ncbi:MAG: DinB family protein [Candidatus Hydrogenedentales bacterium]
MTAEQCVQELRTTKEFFDRSTRCLEEQHGQFRPAEGMMSTEEQVAHVAQTVDWFIQGASRPEGFDMDFDAHMKAVSAVKSLKDARAWLARAFQKAEAWAQAKSPAELAERLPAGPIMGGAPRFVIVGAIEEHTAHHRGALTVYSRLQGLTPAMPYMEMQTV